MDPENVKEFGWALEGEETLVRELEQEADEKLSWFDEDPATLLGDFQLSEADHTVLQDQIVRERMRKSFREALASVVVVEAPGRGFLMVRSCGDSRGAPP